MCESTIHSHNSLAPALHSGCQLGHGPLWDGSSIPQPACTTIQPKSPGTNSTTKLCLEARSIQWGRTFK